MDSLPAEPQGKPKNTGVGSLSLLQQIFLTQELNQGLLHCRQIVYQLSLVKKKKKKCLSIREAWNIYWETTVPQQAKSQLIGKDPDAEKDWGQEEKRAAEDEMVG